MHIKNIIFAFVFVFPFSFAQANLQKDLDDFFNSFGSSSNVNAADVYQGQKAGYATGGGVSVRNRISNLKMISVNMPKFDAGCGGIDIFAGGFSFINDQQLVGTLKNIGSNAVGYAFLLGLETVSPQICNTIKQLQSWSNTINDIGINSCELAAQATGAVWPRQETASQHICRTIGTEDKFFSSYIDARHGCAERKRKEEVQTKKPQDLLIGKFNLTWEAIQKQEDLAKDQELSELLMTLMGTVIYNNENDQETVISYPSKVSDESFINALLEGGPANIYSCSDKKQCLLITQKTLNISQSSSWGGKVREKLLSMQDKILKDEELAGDEINFLAHSRLPLYKVVNALTAYKKGRCPIDLYQISEIVAMDMLVQYLHEGIDKVRDGCRQLRRVQANSEEIDSYLNELNRIEGVVSHYEIRSANQLEKEFQLLQKIQVIEEQLASEIVLH